MSNADTVLANLEKQQEELNRKINEIKKKKAKEALEAYQKRCAIIGDAVLKNANIDADFNSQLQRILNDQVKKKSHRKILDLNAEQEVEIDSLDITE